MAMETMGQQKRKILLIDDDQFLAQLYLKNAEQHPVELRVAFSGEEGLKILREGFVPDNILLDINMPGISGVDTLRAIREEKLVPNADITILSNVHQAEHEEDFKKLGIQRFVAKSFLLPSQILGYVVKGFGTDWAAYNASNDSDSQ
jgi:CheY-like chemotaxis protein